MHHVTIDSRRKCRWWSRVGAVGRLHGSDEDIRPGPLGRRAGAEPSRHRAHESERFGTVFFPSYSGKFPSFIDFFCFEKANWEHFPSFEKLHIRSIIFLDCIRQFFSEVPSFSSQFPSFQKPNWGNFQVPKKRKKNSGGARHQEAPGGHFRKRFETIWPT